MLETKRGQFREIRKSLKDEREVQLVDFVKKSIKYQELLDINDTKKKRLPTLNSKVGEVKKMNIFILFNSCSKTTTIVWIWVSTSSNISGLSSTTSTSFSMLGNSYLSHRLSYSAIRKL